jgi:hypothetical protein
MLWSFVTAPFETRINLHANISHGNGENEQAVNKSTRLRRTEGSLTNKGNIRRIDDGVEGHPGRFTRLSLFDGNQQEKVASLVRSCWRATLKKYEIASLEVVAAMRVGKRMIRKMASLPY